MGPRGGRSGCAGQVYLDGVKFVAFGDLGGDKTYDAFKIGTVQGAYLRVSSAVAQAKKDPWDPGVPGVAYDLEKAKSLVKQANDAGYIYFDKAWLEK